MNHQRLRHPFIVRLHEVQAPPAGLRRTPAAVALRLACRVAGRARLPHGTPPAEQGRMSCRVQVFLTPQHLAIVMEHLPEGDLFQYLQQRRSLPEAEARWCFQQLVLAIDYSHSVVRPRTKSTARVWALAARQAGRRQHGRAWRTEKLPCTRGCQHCVPGHS